MLEFLFVLYLILKMYFLNLKFSKCDILKFFLILFSFFAHTFSFAQQEIAQNQIHEGKKYLAYQIRYAKLELEYRGVKSVAIKEKFVGDVTPSEVIFKIATIENFGLGPKQDVRQASKDFFITLAREKGSAFKDVKSSANALGLMQITPGVYRSIRGMYPNAGLMESWEDGARDHRNAIKFAVLLIDHNLSQLPESKIKSLFGNADLLRDYIASSYNANSRLARSLLKNGLDFVIDNNNHQNRTYLHKMREVGKIVG